MDAYPRNLPGGRKGLPLLGETLSFAKNPFRFIEERLGTHGGIFRTHILGRDTVVMAGPEAAAHFIDPSRISREGSMPPHVQELFGGRSLPLLDGEQHLGRKTVVLQAFSREAMNAYVPMMESAISAAFARWSAAPEVRWLDELKRLSIETICTTVLGLAPGAEVDALLRDYAIVTLGFATLPIAVPGTRYHRALRARNRILEALRRQVKARRDAPADDGLTRILQGRLPDGSLLTDDEAVLELHHIVIAGFIVYAELVGIVRQLSLHPDVRERVSAEVKAQPRGPLSAESLGRMHALMQVVMEVKRITPIIPAVFGRARTSFDFGGKTVPQGWMVMWAVTPSHVSHGVYTNAGEFDPGRFAPERAEHQRHEHAFAPQGAGPATGHRCPGLDFATCAMAVFTVVLLRGYTWELPAQSFEIDWSRTPPEFADGLRARVRAA